MFRRNICSFLRYNCGRVRRRRRPCFFGGPACLIILLVALTIALLCAPVWVGIMVPVVGVVVLIVLK